MKRSLKVAVAVSALVAAVLAIRPVLLGGSDTGHAAQPESCPDVQVVFARGTAEPPGPGRIGAAFVDSLRSYLGDKSIAVHGVDYPASYDFLRALDGANDARQFIESTVSSCPQTKLVLGGYSQGAAVVNLITAPRKATFGLGDPLPEHIADHVAAVVVFGNPVNRVAGPLTMLSPQFGYKTIDVCNGADPICAQKGEVAQHRVYVESGMTARAARSVVNRLRSDNAGASLDQWLFHS